MFRERSGGPPTFRRNDKSFGTNFQADYYLLHGCSALAQTLLSLSQNLLVSYWSSKYRIYVYHPLLLSDWLIIYRIYVNRG